MKPAVPRWQYDAMRARYTDEEWEANDADFMTAAGGTFDAVRGVWTGVNAYFHRPMTPPKAGW